MNAIGCEMFAAGELEVEAELKAENSDAAGRVDFGVVSDNLSSALWR